MSAPELSRPVGIDTLGPGPRALALEAKAGERAALAKRFGLVAIARLAAAAEIARKGDEVTAAGRIDAEVTQSCVVTGAPVEQHVEAPFDLVFRPRPAGGRPDEEVELSAADLDTLFHDGSTVDIGEAVAETLALALDPYPRAAGADAALESAGVKSEEEAGPFGALASLRDKMKK